MFNTFFETRAYCISPSFTLCVPNFSNHGGIFLFFSLTGDEEIQRQRCVRTFITVVGKGSMFLGVHKDKLEDVQGDSLIGIGNSKHDLGPPFSPQAIVERALSQVGCHGYHLKKNNCEHFCTWARYGEGYSSQSKTAFESLPRECGAGESRQLVDARHPSLHRTQRLIWVGVVMPPMALSRYDFLLAADTSVEKCWKFLGHGQPSQSVYELVSKILSEPGRRRLHVGTVAGNSLGWLVSTRLLQRPLSDEVSRRWKVYLLDSGNPADTICEFLRKFAVLRGSAVRQLAACGSSLLVVCGPRLDGETVDVFSDMSLKALQQFSYACWEKRSPSYVYACLYFNGYWLAVASDKCKISDQYILRSPDFPASAIQSKFEEGFVMSCIAAGPSWVFFLDKVSSLPDGCRQLLLMQYPGQDFPKEDLERLCGGREPVVLTAAAGNY